MDNRRHARIPYEVTVDVYGKERSFVARVVDISEGGVFVDTPELLPQGADCQLDIDLGFRSVVVRGEVRWQKPDMSGGFCGMGIRFIQASEAVRGALRLFMQLQLSRPPARPPLRRHRYLELELERVS